MNSIKAQKDMTLKDEPPRVVAVQDLTGEEQRSNYRNSEEAEPKQKQDPAVVVFGGEGKGQCSKEQCCTGTWNVRSMNQDKLDVVKEDKARVNIDVLGNQ